MTSFENQFASEEGHSNVIGTGMLVGNFDFRKLKNFKS